MPSIRKFGKVLSTCLFLLPFFARAENSDSYFQFSDLNFKTSLANYLDSREYHTLGVNSSMDLPLGFKLWGFTDISGDQGRGGGNFAMERYFMEYRVLHDIPESWILGIDGFGVLGEFNDFNGSGNSLFRFGPYYGSSLTLPWQRTGKIQLRVFPYETIPDRWQISLGYFIPLTDRLSLTGFADINFRQNSPDRWVIESELNYKITDATSLLLEYRYNGFEDASRQLEGSGLALGFLINF